MNSDPDRPPETDLMAQPREPAEAGVWPPLADEDAAAVPAPDVPATEEARLGVRALAVDVIRRPRAAMRRLAAHPDRRWIVPLATLAGLAGLLAGALVVTPASREFQRAVAEAQLQRMVEQRPDMFQGQSAEALMAQTDSGGVQAVALVTGVIGAILVVLIGALLGAAVLHFMATVLGGQQTFGQMLSVTSWARLPLILKTVLLVVATALGHFDPHPDGLAGLVAADPFDPETRASLLTPALARVDLWNLWKLGLFVLAVQAVGQLSVRKAIVAVLVLEGLIIAVGLFGVVVQNTVAGLFSPGG
jgi:hypothetical protein